MSLKTTFRSVLTVLAISLALLPGSNSFAAADIYGRVYVSLDILDNGDDSGANVSSNSSRIGFRSQTEIAEGLKGIFQLEQEIRYDNGAGTFATRDSFVGLQGGFGTVRLGFFDTPLKEIRSNTDFFGDQIGDARNLTRLNQAPYSQDFDGRFFNGIAYSTPEFGGGFTFALHHSTNNTTSTNPPDDVQTANSFGLVYKAGDLYIAIANEKHEARNDSVATRIGVKYKLGDLTLAGLFQTASIETLPTPEDIETLGFGASYKLSDNTTVKGQLYTLSAESDDLDAQLIALGVDHVLNKQFRLLFAYAVTDNDDLATYRVTGGGHGVQVTPVAGEQATGLSAGLRYDF